MRLVICLFVCLFVCFLPKLKCGGAKPWSQDWLIAAGAYPCFYRHEAAWSTASDPRRDASPSQVTSPQFEMLGFRNNSPVPIYTHG